MVQLISQSKINRQQPTVINSHIDIHNSRALNCDTRDRENAYTIENVTVVAGWFKGHYSCTNKAESLEEKHFKDL